MGKSVTSAERQGLMRTLNIECLNDPPLHSQFSGLYADTQQVGKTKLDEYTHDEALKDRPWRLATLNRADIICHRARKLAASDAVEDNWRFSIENEVFHRLDYEVACSSCGLRMWIHDVPSSSEADRQWFDIGRNLNRRYCSCPNPSHLLSDGRIFDYHIGTPIYHDDEEINQIIPMEMPDRVYGLARTARMCALFDRLSAAQHLSISEWKRYSPYVDKDSLLLPFIVFESKSGLRSGSDATALRQSAFVIRQLLKLQLDLKKKAGDKSRWETGPLVWYISHVGPEWTIRVAHLAANDSFAHEDPGWLIIRLWTGNVTQREPSLQLLLIMDHLVNWARDEYREHIIGEVEAISGIDCSFPRPPATESDIVSHRALSRFLSPPTEHMNAGLATKQDALSLDLSDILESLDQDKVVLRDANRVSLGYHGIRIQADNIEDFLRSRSNDSAAERLARRILGLLDPTRACIVSSETLYNLQYEWIGREAECMGDNEPLCDKSRFLVRFGMDSYLAVDTDLRQYSLHPAHAIWQQVHDLCFIAIEERALVLLEEAANYAKPWRLKDPSKYPTFSAEVVYGLFQRRQCASVEVYLAAAITSFRWITTSQPRGSEHKDYAAGDETGVLRAVPIDDVAEEAILDLPRKFSSEHMCGRLKLTAKYLITARKIYDLDRRSSIEKEQSSGPVAPMPPLRLLKRNSVVLVRSARKPESVCLFLKSCHSRAVRKRIIAPETYVVWYARSQDAKTCKFKELRMDARTFKMVRLMYEHVSQQVKSMILWLKALPNVSAVVPTMVVRVTRMNPRMDRQEVIKKGIKIGNSFIKILNEYDLQWFLFQIYIKLGRLRSSQGSLLWGTPKMVADRDNSNDDDVIMISD